MMGVFEKGVTCFTSNFKAMVAPEYSNLLIASDMAGWSLDEDAKSMIWISKQIGFPAYLTYKPKRSLSQCVHYSSFFSLDNEAVFDSKHKISVDYFHGKPEQDPAFRKVFENMKRHSDRIDRVRISYSSMEKYALEAGISKERIHLIPIGIDASLFKIQSKESKVRTRNQLGIPEDSLVIGSFQKDGQGWGDGLEPKLIKGPDLFLETLNKLQQKHKNLFVLLTGPARGYVKSGLEKIGIKYKHILFSNYSDIGIYYQALDLYLVTSREEGGPKAILESMASGIPLVTTKCGQAIDLVKNENNGMIVEVEDTSGLVSATERVLADSELRAKIVSNGLSLVKKETFEAQLPRWKSFFSGYLNGV